MQACALKENLKLDCHESNDRRHLHSFDRKRTLKSQFNFVHTHDLQIAVMMSVLCRLLTLILSILIYTTYESVWFLYLSVFTNI